MAHIRQPRPDFGLGFQVKVPKTFQVVRKRDLSRRGPWGTCQRPWSSRSWQAAGSSFRARTLSGTCATCFVFFCVRVSCSYFVFIFGVSCSWWFLPALYQAPAARVSGFVFRVRVSFFVFGVSSAGSACLARTLSGTYGTARESIPVPSEKKTPGKVGRTLPESQGQNLALTVLYVPSSLDNKMRDWCSYRRDTN